MSGTGHLTSSMAAVADAADERSEPVGLDEIETALGGAESATFTSAPPFTINGASNTRAGVNADAGDAETETPYDEYFFPDRTEILASDDIVVRECYVPEWDRRQPDGTLQRAKVRVRSLTGKERDEFEGESITRRGRRVDVNMANMRARLVSRCTIDSSGARLFSDRDIVMLGQKNASAIDRIFSVAQELSGLTDREIDELVGNSASGPNGASGSH